MLSVIANQRNKKPRKLTGASPGTQKHRLEGEIDNCVKSVKQINNLTKPKNSFVEWRQFNEFGRRRLNSTKRVFPIFVYTFSEYTEFNEASVQS